MKGLVLFVLEVLVYFASAYALNLVYKWMFPSKPPGTPTVRQSTIVIAVLMTCLSLGIMVFLNRPDLTGPGAMPGSYVGLVLSMLLGGQSHGPGDPYSWLLFAAPTNFFLYYWAVGAVARRLPNFF